MIHFIVTGFGPFHDVPSNPTTIIVTKLIDYLKGYCAAVDNKDNNDIYKTLADNTTTIILETSVNDVRKNIDEIYNNNLLVIKDDSDNNKSSVQQKVVILLHLGVNYKGSNIQIEQYAYNIADFRVPDECGYQPKSEPIIMIENTTSSATTTATNETMIGMSFETLLNVPKLVDTINRTNRLLLLSSLSNVIESPDDEHLDSVNALTTTLSTDPGRFVCNYIYCYSMNKFQCSNYHCNIEGDVVKDYTRQKQHEQHESNDDILHPSDHEDSDQQATIFRCLFVHVPPFSILDEEQQLDMISQIMIVIYNQILDELK